MNVESKPRPINWRKFIWIALILLVAGYSYGRPTLERITGLDLPAINGEADRGNDARDIAKNENDGFDYTAKLPSDSSSALKDSGEKPTSSKPDSKESPFRFQLKDLGRDKFESPAGLLYTMGPRREHRIDHVLRHGEDNPSRPVHSVFEGSRDEILALIDEGYELVKSNSKRVKSSRDGNRTEHTIDMNRKIGYEGGQKGKRKNYPTLKRLKLILQDKKYVVTAYPYR